MLCPVCNSMVTESVLVVRDAGPQPRNYNIGCCGVCNARFDCRVFDFQKADNVAIQSRADNLDVQALVNYDFYKPDFSDSEYDGELATNRIMIEGCARFCQIRNVYVEIGVGLGFLTRAAAAVFGRVYGLDLEVETAKSVGPTPSNVEFWVHQEFLDNGPRDDISALCAWHVVEHLPDPHGILMPLFRRMPSRSTFFGQIPLFKPGHVIDAHFVWYTENSLIHLVGPYGFFPIYFERDEVNDYLSFCFRKN